MILSNFLRSKNSKNCASNSKNHEPKASNHASNCASNHDSNHEPKASNSKNHASKKIALAGCLIFLVILFVACMWLKGDIKKDNAALLKIMSRKVDLQIKDVHYTEVGDSDSIWEIDADTARYIKKDNIAIFENIRVKLIMADGKTFVMTGDEGHLHTDTRDMNICGNVKIVSDKGDRFMTDYLNYCSSDKRVYTDGRITMENSQMEINGTGLSISLETGKIALLSEVMALIK